MALREIGSAFVRLFVKKDGLSADLKSAEQEVKQTADKMAGSAAAAGGSFDQAGKKIKESYKGIQVFVGALGGIVNVVSKILGLFGLLTAGVWLAVSAVKALSKGINDGEESARALRDRVLEIGKTQSGGESNKPLNELLAAVKEADEKIASLQSRFDSYKGNPGLDTRLGQEREAIRKLIEYETDTRRYAAELAERETKESAKKQAEYRELAANATVDSGVEEYDPDKDPLLKSIEESTKRRADSLKFVIDLMHKYQQEKNDEFWADYHKKQEEAHAARMDQIEREAREQEEAQRRLQGLMSSQRNQSASGDLKTMISLLKVLVDK